MALFSTIMDVWTGGFLLTRLVVCHIPWVEGHNGVKLRRNLAFSLHRMARRCVQVMGPFPLEESFWDFRCIGELNS